MRRRNSYGPAPRRWWALNEPVECLTKGQPQTGCGIVVVSRRRPLDTDPQWPLPQPPCWSRTALWAGWLNHPVTIAPGEPCWGKKAPLNVAAPPLAPRGSADTFATRGLQTALVSRFLHVSPEHNIFRWMLYPHEFFFFKLWIFTIFASHLLFLLGIH